MNHFWDDPTLIQNCTLSSPTYQETPTKQTKPKILTKQNLKKNISCKSKGSNDS